VFVGRNTIDLIFFGFFIVGAAPIAMAKERPIGSNSECTSFYDQVTIPMIVHARPISGEALGGISQAGDREPARSFRIGPFSYTGEGREAHSTDPRFEGVRVSAERGLYHRCGHRMEIIFDRPTGYPTKGPDASFSIHFERTFGLQHAPGRSAAAMAGMIPVVNGYEPGASWPIHVPGATNSFIGLMHPKGGGSETLIVSFGKSGAAYSTRILARLPMRYQSISLLPQLHDSSSQVTLVGRDPDGPYRSIVLEIADSGWR
jgi:hypothetical protein